MALLRSLCLWPLWALGPEGCSSHLPFPEPGCLFFKGEDISKIDFSVGNGIIKPVVSLFIIVIINERPEVILCVLMQGSINRIQMAFLEVAELYFRDMG
jgi:hypothetical protein